MIWRIAKYLLVLAALAQCIAGETSAQHFFRRVQETQIFEPPVRENVPFADFLFDQKLYGDAELEYSRELLREPFSTKGDYCRFQFALCLIKENKLTDAQAVLTELAYNAASESTAYRARLIKGITYIGMGSLERAEFEFGELIRTENTAHSGEVRYFWGWLDLLEGQWDKALSRFEGVLSDSLSSPYYFGRAYTIHRYLTHSMPDIDNRSPALARFLSTIIPGLGQMYTDDIVGGINGMVLNGGLGYLTISNLLKERYLQSAYIFQFVWSRYLFGGIELAGRKAQEFNCESQNEVLRLIIDTFVGNNR